MVLALGLMAAAGSSQAFYVLSANGNLPYSRYCAQIWRGQSGWGVMETTMLKCQQTLNSGIAMGGGITSIEGCHVCAQKFESFLTPIVSPESGGTATAGELPHELVQRFLDGTQELRERFRVDDYERAQEELQRSLWPAPKP
ncbi:MAG TPA: hypothetical protein VM847_20715 [Tahibacter sp.]|nr:hypothetical protein [Tahibacter sp.]